MTDPNLSLAATEGTPNVPMAPLVLWPAIDWRFLLPTDDIHTVGYRGAVADAELRVLEESGIAAVREAGPGAGLDVCIVTADVADGITAARDAVRPGGWVLLRLGTARARPWARVGHGSIGRWRQVASDEGLRVDAAYWHAPNARRCSYLVLVDDRVAIDTMLRRYHGVRFGRAKSTIARGMNGAGLAELLAEDVTLVTQRPAAASAVPSAESAPPRPLLPTPIEASLVGHRRSVSRLIVTPWDAASRHLVCLYLDSDSRQLCGVAKLPRRAWDVSGIRREGEALQELNERSSSLTGHVPQVRELCLGGRPFLLESALVGRAAGPSVASAETAALLDAALDFLRGLPVTGTTGDDPSWFDRLIEQPLRNVEELVALEMVPSLVDSTLRLLEPLRDIQMPLLFEHGDLSHPNLMLTADHQLAVIDWERSESRGLAFHDLCFLLQYVSEARNGAIERGSQLRAFDQAFTGADAWALPWLRRYAQSLGLSDTPVACLVLSTWARSAAGLLARTAPAGRRSAVLGGSATAKTELAMEVGADRDFQLWRHAVNRFEQLST